LIIVVEINKETPCVTMEMHQGGDFLSTHLRHNVTPIADLLILPLRRNPWMGPSLCFVRTNQIGGVNCGEDPTVRSKLFKLIFF
jgi:hypothetical protein